MTAEFTVATLWEIGSRPRNEDRYGVAVSRDARRHVWAVADGVGGHPGGAVAADAAVRAALAYVENGDPGEALVDAVRPTLEAAQAGVAALRHGENAGMATTIALAVSDFARIAWGHVGDSRIYRVRAATAERLTRDHSVAEAMRALAGGTENDDGLPAHGNVLLSSLGADEPHYDVSDVENVLPDDAFLICSDGLWAHLSPKTIVADLRAATSLQDWLDRLGGRVKGADDPQQDNFTAIAFRPKARA